MRHPVRRQDAATGSDTDPTSGANASPLPAESDDDAHADTLASKAPRVRRPKPGERRTHILQTLATMLETPKGDKVTTAGLAARIGVSEAALYRHFASKAQMFEGLIEFIEQSVFSLVNQISEKEPDGVLQVRAIALMLLGFAERNPGMTRVLTGEALVGEHERLSERMNRFVDRLEASLRQSLKLAQAEETATLPADYDPALRANLVITYVLGRWQRYAKSGFQKKPSEHADAQLRVMLQ
jgi:TetR/AcrR family transcriptional regulator